MQQNLQSQQRQKQKGNQYISNWKWRYHRTQATLNLFDCANDWIAAIKIRDWSMLKGIDLGACEIGEDKLEVFAKLQWPNLEFLWLFSNKMKPQSLNCLKDTQLNKLKQIRLQLNNIGGKGTKLLVKINLPCLDTLRLGSCCIGEEGAQHLVKGNWPDLKTLSIVNNFIGIEGREILRNHNWGKLKQMQTWSNVEAPITQMKLIISKSRNKKIQCWISNSTFKSIFQDLTKEYQDSLKDDGPIQ